MDRMLIETDSPYLSPIPYRGKRNEPSFVKMVAEAIAKIKNISFNEVAKHSSQNFLNLFSIEDE